jgi:hypothetical protein
VSVHVARPIRSINPKVLDSVSVVLLLFRLPSKITCVRAWINFWILTLIGPCTTASNIFPSCDVALAVCMLGPYVQYSLVFYFSVKDGTGLWVFAHSFFLSLEHFAAKCSLTEFLHCKKLLNLVLNTLHSQVLLERFSCVCCVVDFH